MVYVHTQGVYGLSLTSKIELMHAWQAHNRSKPENDALADQNFRKS